MDSKCRSMKDPFLSSKLRVGRAKELLDSLKTGGRTFWESHPYAFVAEPDPDGLSKTYKYRLTKSVPVLFDFLVLEAIEHLRAALDHFGYAAAVLGGKREPKSTYFPIADSGGRSLQRPRPITSVSSFAADILAFFQSLEPYK